mmetsp:Transcript_15399/g.29012  ORF Transcript_15399/g.29012 Transcript_15399/m.29012 type:complete len:97 (-) Transcript_15399:1278-1568(-)
MIWIDTCIELDTSTSGTSQRERNKKLTLTSQNLNCIIQDLSSFTTASNVPGCFAISAKGLLGMMEIKVLRNHLKQPASFYLKQSFCRNFSSFSFQI